LSSIRENAPLKKTAIIFFTILAGFLSCLNQKDILTPEERGWLNEHKDSIVISCDPGWPPFEYTENGKYTGFSSEYMQLVEDKLGMKFKFRPVDSWRQVMIDFKDRKIDIVPSIGEESTRKDYMIFTKPYYSVSTSIIVNTDEKRILRLKDLKGKRVGVTVGYDTITVYLRENYPDIKIEFIPNPLSGIRAVSAGMIDAMIESPGVAIYYMKKEGIKNIRFAGDGERSWILRIGVRSDYPILRNILNRVISDISDAERDEMLNKWIEGKAHNRGDMINKACRIVSALIFTAISALIIFRYRRRFHELLLYLKSLKMAVFSVIIVAIFVIIYTWLLREEDKKIPVLTDNEKSWLLSAGEIKFCPNPAAPPLSYLDVGNNFNGLTIDYIREFEKFTGKNFTFVRVKSFAELMDKLKKGEIDIAGPVQKTTERESYLYFTEPYVDAATVIITRADSPYYDSPEKLKGKIINVTEGYTIQKYLEEKHPYLTVRTVPNDFTGLLRVSFGESDAVIADIIASSYIITKEGIGNLKINGFTDLNYSLCFAVNRNKPILGSILNKAMDSIDAKKKREFADKWLGLTGAASYINSTLWIFIAGGLGFLVMIILIVLSWNRALKIKVKQRTYELEQAMSEVKKLQGFLPICSGCKKIRDDSGYWTQIEEYIASHSEAQFSHSLCPDCIKKFYPDLKLKD